jgi:biotin transporter BioY
VHELSTASGRLSKASALDHIFGSRINALHEKANHKVVWIIVYIGVCLFMSIGMVLLPFITHLHIHQALSPGSVHGHSGRARTAM